MTDAADADHDFNFADDGHVTFGSVVTPEGFIPQIIIETSAGHAVRFLADIVIPTNEACSEFCRAIAAVLCNPTDEELEEIMGDLQ